MRKCLLVELALTLLGGPRRERLCLLLSALAMIGSSGAHPAGNELVHEANWRLHEAWSPDTLIPRLTSTRVEPHWLADGRSFWYRYRTGEGTQYWLVDPQLR